ncbi:MAG TPA: DUF2155 domain-containing protein [Rhodospirillales bacterium]|nr:DUF2155 domain-containing protein [Rhodospirillales bacterium]
MSLRFSPRDVTPKLPALIAAVAMTFAAAGPARAEAMGAALLQGLDKVTARISTIEAPVGQPVRFGTLEIVARHCDKTPPEERPEAAAFLQISEIKQGEPTESLFSGWMFASSPALSPLEHPVYDVVVVDCVASSRAPAQSSSGVRTE